MTKSILVVGIGNFGMLLIKQLHELGHDIMAVDSDETRVNEALPYVTSALIGDSTNEEFLKSLGINNYDVCFVAIGDDFQNSLETTCLLKELGGKLVVSRADREVQGKFLVRNGADEVVNPEKEMARWAATRYAVDIVREAITIDANHSIYEVEIPKAWIGKRVDELDIRRKYGINIIGLKDRGVMYDMVMADTILDGDNTMIVIGTNHDLQRCFKL